MTLTYFNDINVYFHMKHHYKLLKNVKSVVDTSPPQSLIKSHLAMHNPDKNWKRTTNEHLRRIYYERGTIKKHDCLNTETKSEAYLKPRPNSRPATRRNPDITPRETLLRSSSAGSTRKIVKQRKRASISSIRTDISEDDTGQEHEQIEEKDKIEVPEKINVENAAKGAPKRTFLKTSSEDHQYLLFLLRITEDIIVNDFYSNCDIKQVFRLHVEANKQRLEMSKMFFHISNLCKELNITCPEYDRDFRDRDLEVNPVKPYGIYLNSDSFKTCGACSAIRTSSLHNLPPSGTQFMGGDGQITPLIDTSEDTNNPITPSLLRILDKLSLSRVTECTEPVPSSSTLASPQNCDKLLDFDDFVKELRSKENLEKRSEREETYKEATPPVVILDEHDSSKLHVKNDASAALNQSENVIVACGVSACQNVNEIIDSKNNSNINGDSDSINEVSENLNKNNNEESTKAAIPVSEVQDLEIVDEKKVEHNNEDSTDSVVKIVLEGPVKDEDYVMLKGPVYVLKALLDTQPKLIIVSEASGDSSKSSVSDASHRTFTVDATQINSAPIAESNASRFDASLHSVDVDSSIENMLKFTRHTYSQFTDSKLLNSDYDLTPEKDECDKYHHLLVDATSSISGLNLSENLLLSDDYLVRNGKDSSVQVSDKLDSYVLPDQSAFGNTYIDRCTDNVNQQLKNIVDGCDNAGAASQDSSLRSEGETSAKQNIYALWTK